MIDFDTIQKRLSDLKCPICKKSRFHVIPSPKVSFGEDIYTTRCLDCPYNFKLSIPTKPIAFTRPDTALWLSGLPCPKCEEIGAENDFQCTPSVRECYYFVKCKACQHPFHERAYMEAFD